LKARITARRSMEKGSFIAAATVCEDPDERLEQRGQP